MIDRNAIIGELRTALASVSPPAAVVAASVSGWGVQEWMYAATIGYIAIQASYLLWKWRREARKP
jgi:hypothetical protein